MTQSPCLVTDCNHNHHNDNFAESLHYDVQDKDVYNEKDDNHAGDVERNNDYHDSADADWDIIVKQPADSKNDVPNRPLGRGWGGQEALATDEW